MSLQRVPVTYDYETYRGLTNACITMIYGLLTKVRSRWLDIGQGFQFFFCVFMDPN